MRFLRSKDSFFRAIVRRYCDVETLLSYHTLDTVGQGGGRRRTVWKPDDGGSL